MSRITPGTVIVGIFAVLFGLVGAYGVRKYLQTETPVPPPPAGPQLQVVPLASMDIEPGQKIVLGQVALLRLTPEEIDKRRKDGKLPPQFMLDPQQVIGRILKNPLKQGDAFQAENFYPEGAGPTIAEKLAPGLRAVTIPVEGTGALGGFDGPGSYVDVVFRSQPDDKAGIPETTVTLLEGVQVLAMEEADKRNPPGAKLENRVTLAVTATQANALKIAEGRGTFALSLRNPEDVEIAAATIPQTLDRLLNLPYRTEHVTAIYRGGSAQTVSFPGAAMIPQPVVALPVAGVLQMRAAQQATSLEKKKAVSETDRTDELAPPSEAAPSATQPVSTSVPSKAQKPDSQTAGTQPTTSDAREPVTAEIPVSVLLDKKAGSAAAPPEAASPAASPATAEADKSSAAPPKPSRPRKLLSDIGRKY